MSQTGEYNRLVTWIGAANLDIESAHTDWDWLRTSASFTTVAGTHTYTLGTGAGTVGVTAATFGAWARHTGRVYLTATGTDDEQHLDYIPYDGWRDSYLIGSLRSTNVRPTVVAISPAKGLCLPPTLAGYTISMDFFSAPETLDTADDADTPRLPAQFHMAVVYRALMMYGAYESASEAYDRGELEFGKLMRRMTADRLPEMGFAGALA
ncbi:MAG: hypothetical protein Q8Q14_00695 [Gemmatimonadales bacterium]|nr:hypothetical protein [Gemmatimonadales bacterium]